MTPRAWVAIVAPVVAFALWLAPAAQADFGFLPGEEGFSVKAFAEGGKEEATLAGSHPYSIVTDVNFNRIGKYSDGDIKDLTMDLPPGMVENPTALPKCSVADFSTPRVSPFGTSLSGESCPGSTQVGIITLHSSHNGGETRTFGVFNLVEPPGFQARWGFAPYGTPITVTPHIREANQEYGLTLDLNNFSQQLNVTGFRVELWGTPWALSHDFQRGNCLRETEPDFGYGKCGVAAENPPHQAQAYLTLPVSCDSPLTFTVTATSWQQPTPVTRTSSSPALQHCDELAFNPIPRGTLSTSRASSPTGYEFSLDGNSAPLLQPTGRATSQVKRAAVRLPAGMSVNPSVASGLGTCSPAQFAAETVTSLPGAGCPNDSKVGELVIESPLVEDQIEGSMFFATPRDNPFGTLLALYLVAKSPQHGIMVKVAGRVESDPTTGQLTTIFDNLPQLPYSHFNVRFREGQRSPLATPSDCGDYVTEVESSPWLDPSAVLLQKSPFQLTTGVGGGPCPQGLAPFNPGAIAGNRNANAAAYSPFYLHLTRTDVEQEITSYSTTLPKGLLGKIAGIPFCPDSLIEAAKHQTGAESATEPACPAASLIGHTYTGYGVGQALSYAPGTLYLAGPYNGSALSIVAIDSAKVGPFDLGTVVIRSAIRLDRQTAQVSIDSAGSDPIPHILSGFPLRLRDIRIYIDRPKFMVNPTSCDPFSVASSLTGAGARFGDSSDDPIAAAPSPFQVSNCSALGFAPKFGITLKGGHERGDNPTLKAVLRPRVGDANVGKATVTLPPKIFLAQENIETICTLKQFAAHTCPKGSEYGAATATTPLLDAPLTGPVYLRSNNGAAGSLPDLVAALKGPGGIETDIVGKIDSRLGGLRARFEVLPDAPVEKFTLTLRGGERGIINNATNTCANPQVATAKFFGQDNDPEAYRIRLRPTSCKGKKKSGGHKAKGEKR